MMTFQSRTIINYLGQFRLYSFVDLLLLLAAAKANMEQFIGISLLWLGFLAFLEVKHDHSYRKRLPRYLWLLLAVLGIVLYRKIEAVLFIIASYFYTKKVEKYWGLLSPFFRGLQNFFLIGGIAGYTTPLVWLALGLVVIRNLLGDFRDIKKDSKENIKTIPVLLGLKRDIKYVHFIMLLITSAVWWSFTDLSVMYLIGAFIIQITTYNVTPR